MKGIQFDAAAYRRQVKEGMPKSKTFLFCLKAFWVGGFICTVGQAVSDLLSYFFILTKDQLSASTAAVMVFFGALLTGLGVYDRIGAYAGAGSVVPITGFANSVVAPAIEFRPEGLVMGVAAKMFNIAGPVLVYGIGSSIIVGVIYFIIGLF
jgi:stage V sporulation protein AC